MKSDMQMCLFNLRYLAAFPLRRYLSEEGMVLGRDWNQTPSGWEGLVITLNKQFGQKCECMIFKLFGRTNSYFKYCLFFKYQEMLITNTNVIYNALSSELFFCISTTNSYHWMLNKQPLPLFLFYKL